MRSSIYAFDMSEPVVTLICGEAGYGKTFALKKLHEKFGDTSASYVDVNYLQFNNTFQANA